MIVLNLVCSKEHEFEGWFKSRADFDAQKKRKLVTCAHCGDTKISVGLSAPNVAPARKKAAAREAMQGAGPSTPAAPAPAPAAGGAKPNGKMAMVAAHRAQAAAMVKAFHNHVKENFDYVGERFADEARKIHSGAAKEREIYGEASKEEVEGLLEDGIDVAPMPSLPDKAN